MIVLAWIGIGMLCLAIVMDIYQKNWEKRLREKNVDQKLDEIIELLEKLNSKEDYQIDEPNTNIEGPENIKQKESWW